MKLIPEIKDEISNFAGRIDSSTQDNNNFSDLRNRWSISAREYSHFIHLII